MDFTERNKSLFVFGGLSGIVGTLCYVAAIAIPMSNKATFAVAICWPLLSIVFAFSLFRYIAVSSNSASNQFAFLMACHAFTLVAAMLAIQLAVRSGIEEQLANASPEQQELLQQIKRSVRLVDMGIDVAWDMFIGASLLFLSFALKGNKGYGLWWGITSAILAVSLIVLNVITFPWPPDSRDLFDIGPLVGVFIITVSGRLLFHGLRMKRS